MLKLYETEVSVMKRYLVIETLDQLRAVSDPLRLQILTALIKEEHTGKQLATLLSLSASKVHYHLKELETHGFVEVVRTEEKNGIIQKFYRAVAYDYKISEELLPSLQNDTIILQETMLNHLRMAMSRVYHAPDESFLLFADEEKRPPTVSITAEVKAPREEINAWLEKYKALLNELEEIEQRHEARIKAGEAVDQQEIFFLVSVGFMTDEQVYVAEDDTFPEGYEPDSSKIVVKKKHGKGESNGQAGI
jgi:DNA-binding transcriptional ArsR family regulator